PARRRGRGDADRARRHALARGGLVAPGGQHRSVDGITVQQLDQPEIEQVAVERRGWAAAVLEDRVDRKLQRNAARVADAVAHALGQVEMDAVAGRKVAARLGDADDRLAAAQLLRRDPVVHEALEIERGLIPPLAIVEPVARTQTAGLFSHRLSGFLLTLRARPGAASDWRRTRV